MKKEYSKLKSNNVGVGPRTTRNNNGITLIALVVSILFFYCKKKDYVIQYDSGGNK